MKLRSAVICLFLFILMSCKKTGISSNDDIYMIWEKLDNSSRALCTEPFTQEKAEAVRMSFAEYLDGYNLFCKTNIYKLSEMQYSELQDSYSLLKTNAVNINTLVSS